MEIERQFLIDKLPPLPANYDTICQGYVALLPEIRIRQIGDDNFTLTVKRGAGLVRDEWEKAISRQEFESLAERLMPGTRMIKKRRYRLPLENRLIAEIHVHDGHLAGFSYVEVELDTIEDAAAFEPPKWFGREVTDDARFSYGALAQVDGMEIVRQMIDIS